MVALILFYRGGKENGEESKKILQLVESAARIYTQTVHFTALTHG